MHSLKSLQWSTKCIISLNTKPNIIVDLLINDSPNLTAETNTNIYSTSEITHHLLFKSETLKPGPGCPKLTTSLVNVSLKFQTF